MLWILWITNFLLKQSLLFIFLFAFNLLWLKCANYPNSFRKRRNCTPRHSSQPPPQMALSSERRVYGQWLVLNPKEAGEMRRLCSKTSGFWPWYECSTDPIVHFPLARTRQQPRIRYQEQSKFFLYQKWYI